MADDDFTDRAEEVERLRRGLRTPSSILLYGSRRMGKSSVIARAVARERRDGAVIAWADFSTATALTDVANRLLRSLSGEFRSMQDRLVEFARRVRPELTLRFDEAGAPVLSLGAAVRQQPVPEQRDALEAILDRVEAFASEHDRPVALVFDEFQDILEIGGERADWYLRGIMQRHRHVSYICAGSKESLIHEMLEQKRAFYKHFELMHLGPIDRAHLARWIEERMEGAGVEAAGLGEAILAVAGERTQDRVRLAREVFAVARGRGRAEPGDLAEAMDVIVRGEGPVFAALWDGLSATQQNALRAVAAIPDQLYAADTLHRFGLASTAAMASAVRALLASGICVRSGSPAGVEVDNPFFRVWLEREVLPDAAI